MSEPAQRMIESNGIRLNIAEQGEGPPVLLCHGFPESWYSWRHQLPVAVDVAIIIERTAEARALELAGVEIDVTLAEPRRQRGWRPGAP